MMKPKAQNENDVGMLEFLEDIIGTVRYKEPLEKLAEKVEDLSNCRIEKLNRVRIVEKKKAALEEPMQEAVQYLQVENTITKIQHQLYHCNRYFINMLSDILTIVQCLHFIKKFILVDSRL